MKSRSGWRRYQDANPTPTSLYFPVCWQECRFNDVCFFFTDTSRWQSSEHIREYSVFFLVLFKKLDVALCGRAHGTMGRQINSSSWIHWDIPAKAPQLVYQMLWYVLTCLWEEQIKDPLLLIGKNSPWSDSSRVFLLTNWMVLSHMANII